jgi:hypothetical protein
MHKLPSRHSRRLLASGVALSALLGVGAVATGAMAGAPRFEVSLTDASASAPSVFVSTSPLRVLDTRPAPEGPIGVATPAPLGGGAQMDLAVAGDGKAVPAAATAVYLNITLDDDAPAQSFLTVWPTGEARPNSSANNALPGLVASNSFVAKIGANGSISMFNQQGAVNVVVDVVGYLLPLSAAGAGAGLQSGAGAPATTTGAAGTDGSFYVDTTTGTLYGPMTGGVYPTPGIALGGVQGAASAYNAAILALTAPTVAGVPVTFDTAGPADGSVTRTNTSTFTVSEDGLYTVDFRLNLTAAAVGNIAVYVNGVQAALTNTVPAAVGIVTNRVLLDANAGDIVQVFFVPTVAGTGITVSSASAIVEQTTSN